MLFMDQVAWCGLFVVAKKKNTPKITSAFHIICSIFWENTKWSGETEHCRKTTCNSWSPGCGFPVCTWTKTTRCPMNGGRSSRLPRRWGEKQPFFEWGSLMSELFLSTDVFTMTKKCKDSCFCSLPTQNTEVMTTTKSLKIMFLSMNDWISFVHRLDVDVHGRTHRQVNNCQRAPGEILET